MQRMIEQSDLDKIQVGSPQAQSKRNEHIVTVVSPEGELFEVTRRNANDLVQNMGFSYPSDKTEEDTAAQAPRKRRPRGEKLAASRKADEERKKAKAQTEKKKTVKNSKSKAEPEAPVKEAKPDLETSALDEEEVVAHDLQAQFDELEAEEAAREAKNSGNA